jgi:hypothetical protein
VLLLHFTLAVTAVAQAGPGIALRGGVWEVLCTGNEMMEVTWFDDPASAWIHVQLECGGVAEIAGIDLTVTGGAPDEARTGPALYLVRNGMAYWPGARGEIFMADMDGAEGNMTPKRTGTGIALDTFIMGPTRPEKVGPGRVLLVLDADLYDDVLAQFGPCAPGTGVTCDGRLDMRTFHDIAGIKLRVHPDDRWIRSQELPKRLQWAANPHQAWLTPLPLMLDVARPPGKENTQAIALEEAVTTSQKDGWAGMVTPESGP